MTDTSKIAYLDCFSGVAGDMLLGAFLHAGLEEELLRSELDKLGLPDLSIEISTDSSQSIACRKVSITGGSGQQLRTLPVILPILENSGLAPEIIHNSTEVFQTLAEAEAKIHNAPLDRVHFHEIGALDTIVDIVGVAAAMHHLHITRLICSPLPLGRGFVECDHGLLPLPAPAVCELLKDTPTYGVDIPKELVTPTGAALVKVLTDDFGPQPAMTVTGCGYGGGNHVLPNNQPNLLRLLVGTNEDVDEAQEVTVTETRLDDWNPEGFPYLCEKLLEMGALDVSLAPCHGKKGRPGYTLQIISPHPQAPPLQDMVFSETTAIGLRYRREQRRTLVRKQVLVATEWGKMTAKKVQTPLEEVIYPEYEECRKIAEQNNVPLEKVYRAVYSGREET